MSFGWIIHELGARECMQTGKNSAATVDKIRLVDMRSECNFHKIEVTSFVSPKWVPRIADADEVDDKHENQRLGFLS